MMEQQVPVFGRVTIERSEHFDYAMITLPGGETERAEGYRYQPVDISYDYHGYEEAVPVGSETTRFSYTPREAGHYVYRLFAGCGQTDEGAFDAAESDNPGYTVVSPEDPRYFAYSRGGSYVPVGINLVGPSGFLASNGEEFGKTSEYQYMGLMQYESWFKKCRDNGVDFVRLWLSNAYFNPSKEQAYDLDYVKFSIIDRIVELARKYGIRLKMTIEHFRMFEYGEGGTVFAKRMYIGERRCESMTEFLTDEAWIDAWMFKYREFMKRYAGDTAIFAFELWNEMNAVSAPFDIVTTWNRRILREAREMAPHNMVTNSLGSLDGEFAISTYGSFCWDECAFKQVHRYLDQGAPFSVCHGDPVDFMWDVVAGQKASDKPLVVAETGAVNDRHSGPFRYYGSDNRGVIFADTVYSPFFCGAASCGHIWHWNQYVEPNNLFPMYAPFANLVKDLDIAKQAFRAVDLSTPAYHALCLIGRDTALVYLRNRADSWRPVLRDLRESPVLPEFALAVPGKWENAEKISIWDGDGSEARVSEGHLVVNGLRYGAFVRLT